MLVADVLGDAVVWFALVPRAPRDTVDLPPIVDLHDGYAQFVNGWEVLYAPVIERDAAATTTWSASVTFCAGSVRAAPPWSSWIDPAG